MAARAYDNDDGFVEQLAVLLRAEGMPRVAGRLFGLLLVSAEPRSLDELAKKLRVSKPSISVNARLLEEKGIVERVGRQADRRDYYQIVDDLVERMLEQRIARIRRLQRSIAEVRSRGTLEHEIVRRRLEHIDVAHNHLLDATGRTLEEWRARKNRQSNPSPNPARSR